MENQTSAALYMIVSGLVFTVLFGSLFVSNNYDGLVIVLFAGLGTILSGLIGLFGVYYNSAEAQTGT